MTHRNCNLEFIQTHWTNVFCQQAETELTRVRFKKQDESFVISANGLARPTGDVYSWSPVSPAEIALAVQWYQERIGQAGWVKSPELLSYPIKHAIERWAKQYVSNGAAICGAIIAGYPIRPNLDVIGQPRNCFIGISRRLYRSLPEAKRGEAVQ